MDPITLAALAHFPDRLEAYYSVVPREYRNWHPFALISSLTPQQLARAAEFEGYRVTLRGLVHNLCSHDQQHLAGMQWLLAKMAAP